MRRFATATSVVVIGIAIAIGCGASNGRAESPAGKPPGQIWRDPGGQPAAQVNVPAQSSLAPLIKQLKPAVVNISTTTLVKDPHRGLRGPQGQDMQEFFEFFGRPMPETPEEGLRGQSLGSGFIINAEGYILTNNHVVKDAEEIQVRLPDGREFAAKVVGTDAPTDVALIKLEKAPANLPTVVLGDSDKMDAGDFVVAIGSPFNLRESASFGILSAKDRTTVTNSPFDDFLQTDAAINSGNSGGPLFNLRGEVIGINTAIVAPQIGSGIGFAVPVNIAKQLIPQLVTGTVARGYLGVTVGDLTADLARGFRVPEGTKGAVIQNVIPTAPAGKAGIQPGDIVTGLNGKAVENASQLTRGVSSVSPGGKATLTVLRKGKKQDVTVTVGKRPDEEAIARGDFGGGEEEPHGQAQAKAGAEKLGLRVVPLTPELARELGVDGDAGVVVAGVTPNGPGAKAGIRRGDVVLEFDQKPVARVDDLVAAVKPMKTGEVVNIRIRRGNQAVFLPLTIGGEAAQSQQTPPKK